jgi:hypothetical protein
MPNRNYLGEFEHIVILALLRLKESSERLAFGKNRNMSCQNGTGLVRRRSIFLPASLVS